MKTTQEKNKEQSLITQEITRLKNILKKQTMTLDLCRQIVAVAERQVQVDKKNRPIQSTYREVSKQLNLPDRAVKESKSILSCYDKLVKSDINDKCVDKVIAEKSISQSSKVISGLNYCRDEDKKLYVNGEISSTELYKRRRNAIVVDTMSLEERAKRLKDDSETHLTYSMITGMFKSETNSYLESLADYTNMVETVSDKRYTRDEALTDITIAFDKVITAISSLKEAIIKKSNTIMEE